MVINPQVEAKAKGVTVEEIKSMQGNDGEEEENELVEKEGEAVKEEEDDSPKRVSDR